MTSNEATWTRNTVADLISEGVLVIGDGYRAKNAELGDEGLPFARAGNVNAGFSFLGADRLRPEFMSKVGHKRSHAGDVVFTSKGTVGRFAWVRDDTPEFVYSPQLCFWRVTDASKLDARFLFYWMHGPECRAQFDALKGQTDMADYISLRDQRSIVISLPPVEEQRQISSVLAPLDEKIESNRRVQEALDAVCSDLFAVYALRAESAEQPLADVLDLVPGRSYASADLDDPDAVNGLLTLKSVRAGGGFSADGIRRYSGRYKETQVARPGDIIVAHTDLTQAATVLGQPAIVRAIPGFEALIACMHVPIVRPRSGLPASYLYYLLRAKAFHEHAYSRSHGSTVLMLNKKAVGEFLTALPADSDLLAFDAAATPMLRKIEALAAESDTLTAVRGLLVPHLTGERPQGSASSRRVEEISEALA